MISLIDHINCIFFFWFIDNNSFNREPQDGCFNADLGPPWNIKLYCVLAHKVLWSGGPAGFLPVGSFVFIYLIS